MQLYISGGTEFPSRIKTIAVEETYIPVTPVFMPDATLFVTLVGTMNVGHGGLYDGGKSAFVH